VAAIQGANDLDDRQKQALIEVYHSMRRTPPDPADPPGSGIPSGPPSGPTPAGR